MGAVPEFRYFRHSAFHITTIAMSHATCDICDTSYNGLVQITNVIKLLWQIENFILLYTITVILIVFNFFHLQIIIVYLVQYFTVHFSMEFSFLRHLFFGIIQTRIYEYNIYSYDTFEIERGTDFVTQEKVFPPYYVSWRKNSLMVSFILSASYTYIMFITNI